MASERPRISLVGPLPPLRGGIPRHTESLRAALAVRSELLTVPYWRLYPRRLFPGRTLEEPESGSTRSGDGGTPATGVDALDPRTWLAAVRAVKMHSSERVILPWWTVAMAPSTFVIARLCHRAGVPVTFVCHNVFDHESAWWKKTVTRTVLGQGARFVVPSVAQADRLRESWGEAEITVHPHPVYRYLPPPEQELPRRSRRELLFFGLIRRYKGIDVLLAALARMPDDDWHLTVAGEPWLDLTPLKAWAREAGISDRVEWIERYVSQREAAALFRRADAVVLPYREATGCGVLALALGQETPVVASDVPGLREFVSPGKSGWLAPPGDADALARALAEADRARVSAMLPEVREIAARWTWDSLAEAVLAEGAPMRTAVTDG